MATQNLIPNVTIEEASAQFAKMYLNGSLTNTPLNLKKFMAAVVTPAINEGLIQTFTNNQGSFTNSGYVEFTVSTIPTVQAKNTTAGNGTLKNFIQAKLFKSQIYYNIIRQVKVMNLNIVDWTMAELEEVFNKYIAQVIPACKAEIEKLIAQFYLSTTPTANITQSTVDLSSTTNFENNKIPATVANLLSQIANVSSIGTDPSKKSPINFVVKGGLRANEDFHIVASPATISLLSQTPAFRIYGGESSVVEYYYGFRPKLQINNVMVYENPYLTGKANFILMGKGQWSSIGLGYAYEGSRMAPTQGEVNSYWFVHEFRWGYGTIYPLNYLQFADTPTGSIATGTLTVKTLNDTSSDFTGTVKATGGTAPYVYNIKLFQLDGTTQVGTTATVTPDAEGNITYSATGLTADTAYFIELSITDTSTPTPITQVLDSQIFQTSVTLS